MEEFAASNGISVRLDGAGMLEYVDPDPDDGYTDVIYENAAGALREFFQHERDEELGRWRWPENPDYVVYPIDGDLCLVLHEPDAGLESWARSRAETVRDDSSFRLAARAYFDAHPETKPWDDAKPGEVWVVHVTGDQNPFAARKDYEGLWRLVHNDSHIPKQFIEHARRIWPEEDK